MAKKQGGGKLHPLPFTTFGELEALGLKATVYCSRCYEHRPIDPAADHLRDRCFVTTRFKCTKVRYTGDVCGCIGSVPIQPTVLLPIGGKDTSPFCSAYPVSLRGRSIMYRSTNRHGQWRSGQAATALSVQAATARWPGASMGRPGGRATPTTTLDENSRPSRREGARCLLKRLGEKPRRLVDQPLARAAHVHQCRGISLPRQYSGSLRLVFIVASGQITPG